MRPPDLKLGREWQDVPIGEILSFLPEFKKKFCGEILATGWGRQRLFDKGKDVEFEYRNLMIQQINWREHFAGHPYPRQGWRRATGNVESYLQGALGLRGQFAGRRVKWFCLDCDSSRSVSLGYRFRDYLKQTYGIEMVFEFGGKNFDKGHFWMFCDTTLETLRQFIDRAWQDSGCLALARAAAKAREKYDIEFFPTRLPKNLIRVPGGCHLRAGQVMPVEYKGKYYETVPDIAKCIIKAQQVTDEFLREAIAEEVLITPEEIAASVALEGSKKSREKRSTFIYMPSRLKVPLEGLTRYGETLARNCPAVNRILQMIRDRDELDEGFLDKKGGDVHKAGLWISNMFQVSKMYMKQELEEQGLQPNEFCEKMRRAFFAKHRMRDPSSHNWDFHPNSTDYDRMKALIPSCETWENMFLEYDICEGCIHKKKPSFSNPNQFWIRKAIYPKDTGVFKHILSVDEIARRVDTDLRAHLFHALNYREPLSLTNRSVQGTLKSTQADVWLAEIGAQGYRSLLSVPSASLALEHGKRLEAAGASVLYLGSWEGFFNHHKLPHKCAKEVGIRELYAIGTDSPERIRRDYCKSCQWNDRCRFNIQWDELDQRRHDVVICMQAHLACKSCLIKFNKAGFDVFVIDENFLGAVRSYFKITTAERKLINELSDTYPWVHAIAHWLHGRNLPVDRVPYHELDEVADFFLANNVPFRLKEILLIMSTGAQYDKLTGLLQIHQLPNIPIKINLDATAAPDLVEAAFQDENLKVIGDEYLIDPRAQHPQNEFVQIIDATSSVHSHEEQNKFLRQLDYCAMRIRKETWIKKALITVYKNEESKVRKYFAEKHSDIANVVTINHMAVGLNEWADCDAQFLLASVHLNAQSLRQEAWELRAFQNAWRECINERTQSNIFPLWSLPDDTIEQVWFPVRVFLRDGKFAKKVQYRLIKRRLPVFEHQQVPLYLAECYTQQSIRARLLPGKRRLVEAFSQYRLYGFCWTKVKLEQDCLAELARFEDTP